MARGPKHHPQTPQCTQALDVGQAGRHLGQQLIHTSIAPPAAALLRSSSQPGASLLQLRTEQCVLASAVDEPMHWSFVRIGRALAPVVQCTFVPSFHTLFSWRSILRPLKRAVHRFYRRLFVLACCSYNGPYTSLMCFSSRVLCLFVHLCYRLPDPHKVLTSCASPSLSLSYSATASATPSPVAR